MKFQKGHTYSKGKGRPKGTKEDFRKQLQELLETNYDKFTTELQGLDGKRFVDLYIKLMEFTQPKLKAIEQKIEEPAPDYNITFVCDCDCQKTGTDNTKKDC